MQFSNKSKEAGLKNGWLSLPFISSNSIGFVVRLLAAFSLLATVGCEQTFQPIKENDLYNFSMYGYLDVSADTQWVRVSPARAQFELPPAKPEMNVTLTNVGNGSTIEMNYALFTKANDFNFVNAWTDTRIKGGQTYQLKAERKDGAVSKVTVTLPGDFPTPKLRREQNFFGEPDTYTLFVDGVDHLAAVQTKWYVRLTAPGYEEKRIFSFSHRVDAEKQFSGSYKVFIEPAKELERIRNQTLLPSEEGKVELVYRQVFVAAAGPEWNDDISSIDDLVYALPGGFSNVEDGLGYVVGINSKWIPFESCYNDRSLLISCPEEEPYW